MDSADINAADMHRQRTKELFDLFLAYGSSMILFGGFAYAIYAATQYPHNFNTLVLLVYSVVLVAKLLLLVITPHRQGEVSIHGSPLEGIEVGLYDAEFDTLLFRTFTTSSGKYSFVVPNQRYVLKILDDRYRISQHGVESKSMEIEQNKGDTIKIVAVNLKLVAN
jgi:hypothetical protein